ALSRREADRPRRRHPAACHGPTDRESPARERHTTRDAYGPLCLTHPTRPTCPARPTCPTCPTRPASQNVTLALNCSCRDEFTVRVIRPAVGSTGSLAVAPAKTVRVGVPKFARLNRLKISARSCSFTTPASG